MLQQNKNTINNNQRITIGFFISLLLFSIHCSAPIVVNAIDYDKQIKEYKRKIKQSKTELTGVKTKISKKEKK